MTRVWISDGSHRLADSEYHPHLASGHVPMMTKGRARDLVPLDVKGDFVADLRYVRREQGRSAVTLWFRVDTISFVEPEDFVSYNAPGVPGITEVPMRIAEFERVLLQKTLRNGLVSGVFTFNKRGGAFSLELVR